MSDEQRRCPGCSNESPSSLPFCASCGLLFETKRCTSCKAEWQGDLAYCASCGFDPASAWANEAPPAPPVEVVPPPPPPDPSMQPTQPPSPPPNFVLNFPIGNPPAPQPQARSSPVVCQRCSREERLQVWSCRGCGASLPVSEPVRPPGGPRSCLVCGRFVTDDQVRCGAGCGGGLPPHPQPWRSALSTDPVEHELLAAIRAAPADETARMVYADWLEQRGSHVQAMYVRDRLQTCSAGDQDWRTITSRNTISGCDRGDCPVRWDALDPDATNERVRNCHACQRPVTYCAEPFGSKDPIVLDVPYQPPGPRNS